MGAIQGIACVLEMIKLELVNQISPCIALVAKRAIRWEVFVPDHRTAVIPPTMDRDFGFANAREQRHDSYQSEGEHAAEASD